MRLFIAVPVPAEIVAALTLVQHKLAATRADIRWLPPQNYHITLKFLGETEEQRIPEICRRLTRAAGEVPSFELEVEGVDRLPEKGPTRVIISRILSPDLRMTKLHRLVDSALGGIGLPMDTRVYVPHLTLGRVNSNHGLNRLLRLLEKHDLDFFGSYFVPSIALMHSTPGASPDGAPVYRPLYTAELKKCTPVEAQSPS